MEVVLGTCLALSLWEFSCILFSQRLTANAQPIDPSFPPKVKTQRIKSRSAPISLRPDIRIRKIMDTAAAFPSVRLVKDPRNNTLYYLKTNGDIYRVNLTTATSRLLYRSSDHGATNTQGMAIGPNGTIYLVGNAESTDGRKTRATIVKGIPNPATGKYRWGILARSGYYPKSATPFDHLFNGIAVDPTGRFVYVNSGSRTDHGEVQTAEGLFPNLREVGLTACIFRLPTNGQNIFLPNNRATLKSAGYVFAEGIRNTFDMAFAPNGDLLGTENGPASDLSEELNWIRRGYHYGFPWRMGGTDNPQQFPDYDPSKDLLLDPRSTAVKKGYFRNDPTFPPRPGITLTGSISNLGPDADSFRDATNGSIKDTSSLGQVLKTFTAHRSPLGLVFDTQGRLSSEFNRDGFMLSFTKGDANGNSVFGPFKDPSQDLLHLKFNKVGSTLYQVRVKRIVQGFANPIDAEIIGNKIYVLEYGDTQGLWEVTLPSR
jgi:hypothetical protein